MSPLEIAANLFNLLSVWFSARNSVHTWWSGIVGCALYAVMFVGVRLYADVTLQIFFIGSCIVGWWHWKTGAALVLPSGSGSDGAGERGIAAAVDRVSTELPITRVAPATALAFAVLAMLAAAGYGWLLYSVTDADYPFIDSSVLALSILAQLLMVARKIETWPVWIAVDCIAVPLYAVKGLWVTAAVYAFFLVLVVMGWVHWSKLIDSRVRMKPGIA